MKDRLREMDPSARRLLGLDRDLPVFEEMEMQEFLKTEDRIRAYNRIDTNTMPRKLKAEQKRGIVTKVLKERLISDEILKTNPTVYLGSGTDVAYPIALGAHYIVLVDPGFVSQAWQDAIREQIREISGRDPIPSVDGFTTTIDFGNGEETVRVELVPLAYTERDDDQSRYILPNNTGTILMYAPQGPGGVINCSDSMKGCVVSGGAILDGATLNKKELGALAWSKTELGK